MLQLTHAVILLHLSMFNCLLVYLFTWFGSLSQSSQNFSADL